MQQLLKGRDSIEVMKTFVAHIQNLIDATERKSSNLASPSPSKKTRPIQKAKKEKQTNLDIMLNMMRDPDSKLTPDLLHRYYKMQNQNFAKQTDKVKKHWEHVASELKKVRRQILDRFEGGEIGEEQLGSSIVQALCERKIDVGSVLPKNLMEQSLNSPPPSARSSKKRKMDEPDADPVARDQEDNQSEESASDNESDEKESEPGDEKESEPGDEKESEPGDGKESEPGYDDDVDQSEGSDTE